MYNWKKTILGHSETMQRAIEVLNEEALRIVMVVNDEKVLVGTITDGDIRRAIINGKSISTKLNEFMYKDPAVVSNSYSSIQILDKMKEIDVLQMPVVDSNNHVVGLETIQGLLTEKKIDNVVVLMAGGFGKRMAPLTNEIPKPLLKVGETPILENILKQFIKEGFHNFYISTHYKAEMLREYFGNGDKWNVSIKYIFEESPLGTAGALGLLPDQLTQKPLILMNADLLTKINFKELLNFHITEQGKATMCVRKYDFQVPYGVIESNGIKVEKISEKPVHSFFINAGIYVLNPLLLDLIDGTQNIDMPNLLGSIINTNEKVNMFPIHEYWLDIGLREHFDKAQKDVQEHF
jgi:dTDP-glucose pyrophosphorylase/predicted transcriptional regulator